LYLGDRIAVLNVSFFRTEGVCRGKEEEIPSDMESEADSESVGT
jgi:hypothetical protein